MRPPMRMLANLRHVAAPAARRLCTGAGATAAAGAAATERSAPYPKLPLAAAFAAGALAAMPMLTGEDFFHHTFVTDKNPDDIVDFYSTEDFLQILGVFPMAINFVLSGVSWDTERENTMAVWKAMEISFELTEEEVETEDGETVVAFFQKRERFKNYIPFTRFLMWDQVQCYGYNRRDDGKCEVFHRGENFYGPLPVRLLVQLHARYVIWATQKHINSPAFGSGDLELQEQQRANVPLHVFNDFLHRLAVAQQIALETGKIAAGSSTESAEETLRKIKKLKERGSSAYVTKKSNLKRTSSRITVDSPEAQTAIDSVLKDMVKTKDGQIAAAAALDELMRHPEVELQAPRYGGAFEARVVKNVVSNEA